MTFLLKWSKYELWRFLRSSDAGLLVFPLVEDQILWWSFVLMTHLFNFAFSWSYLHFYSISFEYTLFYVFNFMHFILFSIWCFYIHLGFSEKVMKMLHYSSLLNINPKWVFLNPVETRLFRLYYIPKVIDGHLCISLWGWARDFSNSKLVKIEWGQ